MSTTYLMSYPGADWQIRGGENFRSKTRQPTSPRRALREWLTLCDAITRAGGHILVMPPPAVDPPLTGLVYAANLGHAFRVADRATYLLSRMSVAHRQPEREFTRLFLADAGLESDTAAHTWEGQADLQLVAGNRYIATWGVRSVRESLDDVRRRLPQGARLLDVQLREPFFHGDTCLDTLVNRAGDTMLLAHPGAFVGTTLEGLRQFLGSNVEVYPVDEDDALGYACNSLCVGGTVLMPAGLSSSLRGQLVRRGFTIEELELPELFGKGGGGPRCLVNELRGLVVNAGAPDYATLRDELHLKLDEYPETVAPSSAASGPGGDAPPGAPTGSAPPTG